MTDIRTRTNFGGSRPRCAEALLTAVMLGVQLNETGWAAADEALSPFAGARNRPPEREPLTELIDAGPHHRTWRIPSAAARRGADPTPANTYVELASGLNRWDPQQLSWQAAEARFARLPNGRFLAQSTQHQIALSPDLNVHGAVEVRTPDGLRLSSTILGLALVDASSARSVLLAETRHCEGVQVSPTEVLYRNAFEGLLADVLYLVTRERFEQNVIVRERIPPEAVAELGLDPSHTRLLVLTEFFDPPPPAKNVRRVPARDGRPFVDEELGFGAMWVGPGRAWKSGSDNTDFPVHKSWERIDGRQLLVEAVALPALFAVSERLPAAPGDRFRSLKSRVRHMAGIHSLEGPSPDVSRDLPLPEPRQASAPSALQAGPIPAEPETPTPAGLTTQVSLSPSETDGVIIDYSLNLAPITGPFTFKADTTYHITGPLILAGPTTLEGGTVIKFSPASQASLILQGPILCRTGPYRPAILTARDDDSVGSIITGSSGQPGGAIYAQPAIQVMSSGQTLHDLRIAHAQTGLFFHDYSAGSNSVRHAQLVRCGTAFKVNGYGTYQQKLTLHNVLIHASPQPFLGYSFTAQAEHLTVCDANDLVTETQLYPSGIPSSLGLVNSLLVGVQRLGNAAVSQLACQTASRSNEVFRTVGAGGFYLARAPWTNAGTTNIHPTLAAELKLKTTAPPSIRTGGLSTDLQFAPSVGRDTGAPDPGYHYDPIDVAAGELTLGTARTLTVLPSTAVAAFGAFGIRLGPGARLQAAGDPLRPVRLFRYTLVQEQPLAWGATHPTPGVILGTDQTTANTSDLPSVHLRFAELAGTAGPACHVLTAPTTNRLGTLTVQDCQLRGGRLDLAGSAGSLVTLQNSLFERATVCIRSPCQTRLHNNLFWRGMVQLERTNAADSWIIRDTAFHDVDLRDLRGGAAHGHNAYLGTLQARLTGASSNDVALAGFPYVEGPLGSYYHGSTNLLNVGSRLAKDAGLYHHCTQPTQVKDADTTVDVGYHYLALDARTPEPTPNDTDADGIADYVEDANGNAAVDSDETDWRDARDLGLRVRISRPSRSSPTP